MKKRVQSPADTAGDFVLRGVTVLGIRRTRGVTFLLAAAIHAGIWLIPIGNRPDEWAGPTDTMEIAVVDLTRPGPMRAGHNGPASGGASFASVLEVPAKANGNTAVRAVAISHGVSEPIEKAEPPERTLATEAPPRPETPPPTKPADNLADGASAGDPSVAAGIPGPPTEMPGSTASPSPFGKVSEGVAPGGSESGPAQAGGGPGGDGTGSGTAGGPEAASLMAYVMKVHARLQMFHNYPFWAKKAQISGVVALRLTIAKTGRLIEAKVEATSGSVGLDTHALETARRAAPFPAFPPALKKEACHVIVRLVYSPKKG